jgi:hypothetical protein
VSATVGHAAGDALDQPHVVTHDRGLLDRKGGVGELVDRPLNFGVVA